MLDVALLGILEDGPQHGYELRKRLKAQSGLLASVSFGSIYPALSRLERSGAVEKVEAPPVLAVAPPTGSLTGEWAAHRARRRSANRSRRSKKVYRVTPGGRQLFLSLLADPAPDDARSFALRLSLARFIDPEARLALLERRRAQLVQLEGESAERDPALDAYARAVAEHVAHGIKEDIAWLDRLIEAERTPQGAEAGGDRRGSRRSA
jgi:DNA-binding PadR family transcriptional regulator